MFNSNIKLNFILGIYVYLQLLIFLSAFYTSITESYFQVGFKVVPYSVFIFYINITWSHNFTYFIVLLSLIVLSVLIGLPCVFVMKA